VQKIKKIKLDIIIIIVLVSVAFAGALDNDFVWDDHAVTMREEFQFVSTLPRMLVIADTTNDEGNSSYYRPITYLNFFIDNQLFGRNPGPYHLEQLLWHILAAMLLYLLVQAFFQQRLLSLVTALLFSVHPVTAEPVNFIAARNNILCLVFMLFSLYSLVRAARQTDVFRRSGWYSLSLLVYFLSMLSKEPGVSLVLFVGGVLFSGLSIGKKERIQVFSGFVAVTVLYFALRVWVLGTTTRASHLAPDINLTLMSMFYYFRLVLWPLGLHPEYRPSAEALGGLQMIIAFAGLAALVALAIKRQKRPEGIGALWLIVCFLPISNLIPIPSSAVADRYMYVPLPGFALIAGAVFQWLLLSYKKSAIAILVAILAMLTFLSSARTNVWKDDVSLWRDVVIKAPDNYKANYNLGKALMDRGDIEEAFQAFQVSAAKYPSNVETHIALGILYRQTGQIQLAVKSYKKAISINPNNPTAHYNLGNTYAKVKQNNLAIESYRRAIAIDSENSDYHYNLAYLLLVQGQLDSVMEHAMQALKLNPDLARIHFLIGVLYMEREQYVYATKYLEQTIALDPTHSKAKELLSSLKHQTH
jgi:tetratricopeptide (TPR) repeat protein